MVYLQGIGSKEAQVEVKTKLYMHIHPSAVFDETQGSNWIV